jgi:hypothetical protein
MLYRLYTASSNLFCLPFIPPHPCSVNRIVPSARLLILALFALFPLYVSSSLLYVCCFPFMSPHPCTVRTVSPSCLLILALFVIFPLLASALLHAVTGRRARRPVMAACLHATSTVVMPSPMRCLVMLTWIAGKVVPLAMINRHVHAPATRAHARCMSTVQECGPLAPRKAVVVPLAENLVAASGKGVNQRTENEYYICVFTYICRCICACACG